MNMTAEQLEDFLGLHKKWLSDEEGGKRASLQRADLQRADLQGADLRGADLRGVNLEGAYLRGANLEGADLEGAYLQRADMQRASLEGAYLQHANLEGANLEGAYLQGAYLEGANLEGADLRGANLRGAYLEGARINWRSHALISEILRRSAGTDVEKRKIAGLVAISTNWCWSDILPHVTGDLNTLAEYITDNDNHPSVLDTYVTAEPWSV